MFCCLSNLLIEKLIILGIHYQNNYSDQAFFFGQNPSYSSKFCELARTFLGHRAILARENYKILI